MKTNKIEIITLEADEGNVLTNGEIYSEKIYLGKNDSADNWYEISKDQIPEDNESGVSG